MKKKIELPKSSYEENHDIKKLTLSITIVAHGQGKAIIEMLKRYEVSAFFSKIGEGTASKSLYDLMGIADNRKDVIFAVVRKSSVVTIKKEMDFFFSAARFNAGLFFTIDLSSIIGVASYRFLSNT